MGNLVSGFVDKMRDALRAIVPKPVRGFVIEICEDLRAYPEEWERTHNYSYRGSLSKSYSKGIIEVTLYENWMTLGLYRHELELIPLTRKEESRLYKAALYVEKHYDKKWKKKQKIDNSKISDTVSKVLESFRNP